MESFSIQFYITGTIFLLINLSFYFYAERILKIKFYQGTSWVVFTMLICFGYFFDPLLKNLNFEMFVMDVMGSAVLLVSNLQSLFYSKNIEAIQFPENNPNPVLKIHKNGKVLYMNPAAKNLWPKLDSNKVLELCGSALETKKRTFAEYTADSKIFGFLCVPAENANFSLIFAMDISELKLAHQKLKQEQEQSLISKSLAILGESTAGIAHEIANPLTVISALSDRSLSQFENKNVNLDEMQVAFSKIKKQTDRINKIVKGLKSMSRISDFDDPQLLSLGDVLEEVADFLKYRFREAQVELRLHKLPEEWKIEFQEVQLFQVFTNLLTNAIDAVLSLEEKWVQIEVKNLENVFVVRVSDSGRGISKEIQEKIFQPLFNTKENGKGTGLGLSLVTRILQNHDGKIRVDDLSVNTCFELEIPKFQNSTKQKAA